MAGGLQEGAHVPHDLLELEVKVARDEINGGYLMSPDEFTMLLEKLQEDKQRFIHDEDYSAANVCNA